MMGKLIGGLHLVVLCVILYYTEPKKKLYIKSIKMKKTLINYFQKNFGWLLIFMGINLIVGLHAGDQKF
jgi:hypothetical protein